MDETPSEPRAVKWEVGRDPRNGITRHHIEEREQRDGSVKYVVSDGWAVLNKRGEWQWEPQPSSRHAVFMVSTRYKTFAAALASYRAALRSPTPEGPQT